MLVFATPVRFAIRSMLAPATPCSMNSSSAPRMIAWSMAGLRGRPAAFLGLRSSPGASI
jgi:hypothetical protein